MLADVVAQSLGAAQVFFLVGLILAAIATIVALFPAPNIPFALLCAGVTFGFAGLLFFA
jgi:hypothetical protein